MNYFIHICHIQLKRKQSLPWKYVLCWASTRLWPSAFFAKHPLPLYQRPTFYNINDNITLVDVIPWVFLSRLPSQKTVLCCLLVILLSTILHPRTAHFNCPDSLSLWYANLLIHTVSLDTLSHHPVSLHYRAELFPCELMCFSNQHLTPFLSRFLIKHLNGPHEKVWALIHFHRCLGFSEFISLFNWCGPCPLLALDRT